MCGEETTESATNVLCKGVVSIDIDPKAASASAAVSDDPPAQPSVPAVGAAAALEALVPSLEVQAAIAAANARLLESGEELYTIE